MMKVIFINSHPIQYFVPLYRDLNKRKMAMECWYCSDENVKGHFDRQFNTNVAWDIPLLDGYTHRFFRNRSWKPSLYNGFFGLINPGIWRALFSEKKATIVVHGWNYMTHVGTIIIGRLAGHRVCIRGESPLNQEMMKSSLNRFLKRVVLQGFLFPFVRYFLFIGKQNKLFYQYYGVGDHKLLFTPYAVDNQRFQEAATTLNKPRLRTDLNLPSDAFVILFAAKFIDKKRPMDLLRAFEKIDISNKFLVMVGDGELRSSIELFVKEKQLNGKVLITGFVNQTEIVKYYKASDVFVLCSGVGETWGLSVNEAMNFDLPIIVSRTAGCSDDLVDETTSGYSFEEGNIDQLAAALVRCRPGGQVFRSADLVAKYSFEQIAKSLEVASSDQ
jgi:glycosyltransferase involved in cell wall biosynthesis